MNLKKIGVILFLISVLMPIGKVALAQTTTAGFIPGNIWYSKDPFVEGDKIKIYTLIFNPDARKFSGTVDFFDKDVLLGSKDFNISGTSTKDISIDWTVTAGDHQIFGQIKNAKFTTSVGASVDASITDNKTTVSLRTVSAKVVAENIANGVNTIDTAFNTALDSIQNIGNSAKDTLPATVSQSVANSTNSLDSFRENTGIILQTQQGEIQKQINALDKTQTTVKNSNNGSSFEKPFNYVKLFFLSILTTIFRSKLLFYGILIVTALLLVRYIWHLIF